MKTDRKKIGSSGEDAAARFLMDNGFTLVARNFRAGKSGEIDIIAQRDRILSFVEVKKRSDPSRFGGARYSISPSKKRKIKFTAKSFLAANPLYYSKDISCRFDMIAIEEGELTFIEDIFR